ncbi:MAG: DegT/DnrJ/EryC1/StrS family aminotransferase [Candidatus Hydrothermarchaeaceae archaeon]
MSFPRRVPSTEAVKAMSRAALELSRETIQKAESAVSKATGHKYVRLVSSGSAAILAVLEGIDGKIMIPDQGGWRGFKTYPGLLGLELCETKTNLGLIEPETLADEIKKYRPDALLLTSFAGYIAEQDVREISRVCREREVILVEDVSGSIGDAKLAKGKYADAIVCSTGEPKILNVLSGGFLSTDRREIIENSKDMIHSLKISHIVCAGIIEELKNAGKIVKKLINYADILKEEVNGVVHREKRGVCVGIEMENAKEFARSARGLRTDDGRALLTTCPRYERFLGEGFVVELKKLDVLNIEESEILEIAKILKLERK